MTSQSLSSWLSIKSDDIDCGLAADFDGSLSGLGVELGSSTYNMSEALLALPVFKQESLEPGDDGENACHSQDVSSDSPSNDVSGFSLELLRGALVASSETDDRFQYILNAATSPATKLNEETLTYLNQGQSYEIKLKKYGESLENTTVKSIIRVVFHDRRLQYAELEQLQLWRLGRPGERLLDLDVPLSTGIFDVTVEPNKLNSVAFKWDPNKECIVFVKVHCISTEFTPKKHGGEKGVPFRVQIETYAEDEDNWRIMHCASCQVKVFKPKGADRKQKTDRDKMEKRLGAEKDKYQPSYEVTVLSELPLDQAQSYLQQLAQQELLQPEYKKLGDTQQWSSTATTTATTETTDSRVSRVVSFNLSEPYSPASSVESLPLTPVTLPMSPIKPAVAKNCRVKEDSTETLPTVNTEQVEPLSSNATSNEVTKWLLRHRFSNYTKVFQNFAGADLLRLTRDDLIQICGLVDGIRLNNALQSKSVRPKLTIYVSQNDGKSKKKKVPTATLR